MARVTTSVIMISLLFVVLVLLVPAVPVSVNSRVPPATPESDSGASFPASAVSYFYGILIGNTYARLVGSQGTVLYVSNCTYTAPVTCDAIIKTASHAVIDFRYANSQDVVGLGTGDSVFLSYVSTNGTATVQRTYFNPLRS